MDSTCATPIFTRPLALGADVVMHSATKYLNGHSDVIAGALGFARADALFERVRDIRKAHGLILHPFEAFLLIRGLRTLDLRVRASALNALKLAHRFAAHPKVVSALYPGLPGHPGHETALKQMDGGFGGMLSIRVRGGADAAIAAAAPDAALEARDLARRRRVADRASRLDRGRRLALPARSPAPVGRDRGRRGSLARYRRGA